MKPSTSLVPGQLGSARPGGRAFAQPSPAFASVAAAQLEAVCLALGSTRMRCSVYLLDGVVASSRLRLSRCVAWPPPAATSGRPLAPSFEALLDEDDVALLVSKRSVLLPSGALVLPLEADGALLGLLAAEGGGAGEPPPGHAGRALGAAARALSLCWALDQSSSASAAQAGEFLAQARQPLAALSTLGGLLSRQLGAEGGPPLELAEQLRHQAERLRELTNSLEEALYASPPAALLEAGSTPPLLPPPPQPMLLPARASGAGPQAAPPGACDVSELCRSLCSALAAVMEGRGELVAEGLGEEGHPMLTSLPAREVRSTLSATLQAAAAATPLGGRLRVSAGCAPGGEPLVGLQLSSGGAAAAAVQDSGLRLAAAALERGGGQVELVAETILLHFPA